MKQTVKLIEKKDVAKDTMEFVFSRPEGFTYKAGQSIDLYHVNPTETDDEGNKRAFSLTSAPFEKNLMITTRMRDTAFKRVLKIYSRALTFLWMVPSDHLRYTMI
jgi:ferredoxin-NADP reductase